MLKSVNMEDNIVLDIVGYEDEEWKIKLCIQTKWGSSNYEFYNSLTVEQWKDFIQGIGPCSYDKFPLTRKEKYVSYCEEAGFIIGPNKPLIVYFEMKKEIIMGLLSDAIDEAIEKGFFGKEVRDAEYGLNIKGSE